MQFKINGRTNMKELIDYVLCLVLLQTVSMLKIKYLKSVNVPLQPIKLGGVVS